MNERERQTRQRAGLSIHHAAVPAPAEYVRTEPTGSPAEAAALRSGPLWRLPRVLEYTSISKSQWYRMMAAGDAPLPVHLSERSRAWYSSEVLAWAASRSKCGAA